MVKTMTAKELAAYWGISDREVRRYAQEGKIPGTLEKSKNKERVLFDAEVTMAEWVPPKIKTWGFKLNAPVALIDPKLGLKPGAGVEELRNSSLARLHDLNLLVTSEEWAAVVRKAVDQAVSGEWRARKWLSDYLVGPPIQRLEADVEITDRKSLTDEARAQAVSALLELAGKRQVVVDVTPEEESDDLT